VLRPDDSRRDQVRRHRGIVSALALLAGIWLLVLLVSLEARAQEARWIGAACEVEGGCGGGPPEEPVPFLVGGSLTGARIGP